MSHAPALRVAVMARTLGTIYWTILAGSSIGLIVSDATRESSTTAVVVLVISVASLARVVALGFDDGAGRFAFRSWFRTYRFTATEIRRFKVAPYAGMANWWRLSPVFAVIVVSCRDRDVPLRFTVARKPRAAEIATDLNRRLAQETEQDARPS